MKNKPIIILNGEPNSIFLEILFKSLKKKNYKSPIILVSSYELIKFYMRKLKFNKKINIIDFNNFNKSKLIRNSINLINVKLKLNKNWNKISKKSNKFIYQSFNIGLKLLVKGETHKLINGPISKKNFLNKKFPGITEYIASKVGTKKYAMLIYNKDLSVCPLTTHIPLKKVAKKITKKNIHDKVSLITSFYKKKLKSDWAKILKIKFGYDPTPGVGPVSPESPGTRQIRDLACGSAAGLIPMSPHAIVGQGCPSGSPQWVA